MTVAAVLLGMIAWAFLALGSAPVMSARAELLIMALSIVYSSSVSAGRLTA
ncbi:MAG TPA: hypothetical protein VN325_39930 [Steroidobacteraceae bacterium]|nr:hypothetical protein [Steroidobacteraceae bacterium]